LEPACRPHVAVLHANLGGDKDHGPYAPCTITDLVAAPVDYWALGHIHLRQLRVLAPNRYAAYCGNLQGRNFKDAECHPKGAYVVPVEDGQIGEPAFVPCDRVRFVQDDVLVEPDDDIEAVLQKVAGVMEAEGVSAARVSRARRTIAAHGHRLVYGLEHYAGDAADTTIRYLLAQYGRSAPAPLAF
jgi:hypothetical protein